MNMIITLADFSLVRMDFIILNILIILEKIEHLQEMEQLVSQATKAPLHPLGSTTPYPSPSTPGGTSTSPTPATTPSAWSSAAPLHRDVGGYFSETDGDSPSGTNGRLLGSIDPTAYPPNEPSAPSGLEGFEVFECL